MSGGGGGDSVDRAYNAKMAQLAEFTGGMGFNDYLRQYGYTLNPEYGGVTNPMASYQIGSGAKKISTGQGFTVDSAGVPVQQQPQVTQVPVNYGDGITYEDSPSPQLMQQAMPLAQNMVNPNAPSQEHGWFRADSPIVEATGAIPQGTTQTQQPYFVQATDRYGNPIISAIDLEDQSNRINYELAPMYGETQKQVLGTVQDRLARANDPVRMAQDKSRAMGEATANVQQAFNPAALRTQLTRAGQSTQSGQFTDSMAKLAFERSKALAGGRYRAAQDVEKVARDDQMAIINAAATALPA